MIAEPTTKWDMWNAQFGLQSGRMEMDEAVPIAELRRLCDEATPAPWTARNWNGRTAITKYENPDNPKIAYSHEIASWISLKNADFIAAAREWLPKLLDIVEQKGGDPHTDDRRSAITSDKYPPASDILDSNPRQAADVAPSSLVLETTAKERDRWKRWAVDPYIRHPIDPIELTVLLRDFNLQSAEIARLEGALAEANKQFAALFAKHTVEIGTKLSSLSEDMVHLVERLKNVNPIVDAKHRPQWVAKTCQLAAEAIEQATAREATAREEERTAIHQLIEQFMDDNHFCWKVLDAVRERIRARSQS